MARTPGKKPKKRWIVLGVAGLVLVAGVVAFLVLRPGQTTQPVTRTQQLTVSTSTEQVTLSMTGALASGRQAELGFGASGTVTSVAATVGQQVTKGATLATIDDTVLRNNVALAAAQLTAARANLTQVTGTSSSTSAQVASARAQVNSADARLAAARASLASATIVAPFDGTVAAVNLTVGNQASGQAASASGLGSGTASAGSTSAIVLIDPKAWVVNGTVGAADVGTLKPGQTATIQVQGTTVTAPATVHTVGIVATTTNGATSFPVTLQVEGSPQGFYYGASVNVTVNAGTYPDIITLPTAALTTVGTTTTVQKLVDGQPVTTPVTLGKVFGDRTQVTAGLADGDTVQITIRVNPNAQRSGGVGFPGLGGGAGGGVPGGVPGSGQNRPGSAGQEVPR